MGTEKISMCEQKASHKIDRQRRHVMKGALALSGAAVLGAPAIVLGQNRKIVTRDPGGPFTQAFNEAFYKPFKQATGITVVGLPAEAEPSGMIKAMVDAKNYQWDMAHISKSTHLALAEQGYLAPIAGKNGLGANARKIPQEMRTDFILGVDIFATVIAYRTDTVKRPPSGWKDFFDIKGYPGLRGLRKNPFDTLEEALMADGVAPGQLYPLDVDRAFRKLNQIKRDVGVWWDNGAQSAQMLKTGEVDMLPIWNGRAQVVIDGGAPVKLVWNQAIWTYEGFSILKGGPNVDMCREFIEFCAQPRQQAIFTDYVCYGPTSPDAFQYVKPDRAPMLPNHGGRLAHMLQANSEYWGKHKDAATDRFNAWLLA
ncbi:MULTISPECIES: ABC transporter substrate-binding protein [Burkholderia]|uniref:ABC transporter substrate-binding protein n=1 Tax=Burkholderia TaxID=32008 RepID=UPI000C0043FF|nr:MULTISPECIES: ABC transporter substrate-binding protein [Burkholderia]PFH28940.1 putative spermidine/putrescine transport system substrate-binding protein [Burkholderia sp. JKS000303]